MFCTLRRTFALSGRAYALPVALDACGLVRGWLRCIENYMANDNERSPQETASFRNETIKRLIGTPPEAQKDEPKRRPSGIPGAKQLPKHRTNKKRDKA